MTKLGLLMFSWTDWKRVWTDAWLDLWPLMRYFVRFGIAIFWCHWLVLDGSVIKSDEVWRSKTKRKKG